MKRYEIIVVGSGFSGSIIARKIAEDFDIEVLVLERRNHIAGNMYDAFDENGILIQKYGPHFINANEWWIIEFLKKYAEMIPFDCTLKSFLDERYVCLPWNYSSVKQLLEGEQAEATLAAFRRYYPDGGRIPIFELLKSPEHLVRDFSSMLYKKAFETYSSKMWGIPIEDLDESVAARVPFCAGYDGRYLAKDFQYLPKDGFTSLFQRMLSHPRIAINLNTEATEVISLTNEDVLYEGYKPKALVYTGAIDELFGEQFGSLPYRSLDIQYRTEAYPALPCDIVSYPQAEGYTRDTEYRRFTFGSVSGSRSIVAREYPLDYNRHASIGNEPYYPVINESNQSLYEQYATEALKYNNLFLCGRLAEYKYFNMDHVIHNAFRKYEKIKRHLQGVLAK